MGGVHVLYQCAYSSNPLKKATFLEKDPHFLHISKKCSTFAGGNKKYKKMKKITYLLLLLMALTGCRDKHAEGKALLQKLNDEHLSLVVSNHDSVSSYSRYRVDDLMDLNLNEPERLHGAVVADKRIGNAAAVLIAYGGVKEVHTNYVTRHAREILEHAGVRLYAHGEADMILNRDGTGQCPMDSSLNEILDPGEGMAVLRALFYPAPPVRTQGEALLGILNADELSLVVLNNDSLSTYTGRGVSDLVEILSEEPCRLEGAIVADKMVGRAAAALMAKGGVKAVFTNLISTPGKELLEREGVRVFADEEVPQILNRDRSGMCPIEASISDAESVEECVEILKNRKI